MQVEHVQPRMAMQRSVFTYRDYCRLKSLQHMARCFQSSHQFHRGPFASAPEPEILTRLITIWVALCVTLWVFV